MEKCIFSNYIDGFQIKDYIDLFDHENYFSILAKYINNPTFLRLMDISYFCAMERTNSSIYDFTFPISRAEHSITTALLALHAADLAELSEKEKKAIGISALYHDLSTPCFSHAIDYMKNDALTQSTTELNNDEFIKRIPSIQMLLNEDGLSFFDIDHKSQSLVDLPRPRLCADRLDGIILTSLSWTKIIDLDIAREIIKDIKLFINEDNNYEIGFISKETADYVAYLESIINNFTHSNMDTYFMMLLANIARHSIKMDYITENDLYHLTENELFSILFSHANSDYELRDLLTTFHSSEGKVIDQDIDIKKRILTPLYPGGPKRF